MRAPCVYWEPCTTWMQVQHLFLCDQCMFAHLPLLKRLGGLRRKHGRTHFHCAVKFKQSCIAQLCTRSKYCKALYTFLEIYKSCIVIIATFISWGPQTSYWVLWIAELKWSRCVSLHWCHKLGSFKTLSPEVQPREVDMCRDQKFLLAQFNSVKLPNQFRKLYQFVFRSIQYLEYWNRIDLFIILLQNQFENWNGCLHSPFLNLDFFLLS